MWHAPASAGAFTLVELLVAMTVTVVLVVALMQVFNGAASSWRHSEAQVDAYREARGALQIMARDLSATLQASYAQAGGGTGSTAVSPPMPTLVLQRYPGITPDPSAPINEEVYCLTNIPNRGASSLCAVGYFCQWMPDTVAISPDGVDRRPRAYALMRQAVDSNGTFLRIQAAAATAGTSPLKFLDLYSRTDAQGAKSPPVQLAAYIWDLRFRIDTDLNDLTEPNGNLLKNAHPPPDHSQPQRYYGADPDSVPYPPRLPAYVEVRFKALSNIAGRRLEGGSTAVTQSTWMDTASGFAPAPNDPYNRIIRPNLQQFVLRVPLTNATPLP